MAIFLRPKNWKKKKGLDKNKDKRNKKNLYWTRKFKLAQ
jgi:hypothetical protein